MLINREVTAANPCSSGTGGDGKKQLGSGYTLRGEPLLISGMWDVRHGGKSQRGREGF